MRIKKKWITTLSFVVCGHVLHHFLAFPLGWLCNKIFNPSLVENECVQPFLGGKCELIANVHGLKVRQGHESQYLQ